MITTEYLTCEHQAVSGTLRSLIAREWGLADPPTVMSACGVGDSAAKKTLTENDFLSGRKGEGLNYIRVYDGDTNILNATNNFIELESTVYIDIFARPSQIVNYADEVDRIIYEAAPNGTSRVRKAGGSLNSAIWTIRNYIPEWRRIAEDREEGLPEQYAGEIQILWQKTKT